MQEKKEIIPTQIRQAEKKAGELLVRGQRTVFERFPIVFTFLVTFGFVATIYGAERLLDRVQIFAENPLILFAVGVVTLVVTGMLYKKLL